MIFILNVVLVNLIYVIDIIVIEVNFENRDIK